MKFRIKNSKFTEFTLLIRNDGMNSGTKSSETFGILSNPKEILKFWIMDFLPTFFLYDYSSVYSNTVNARTIQAQSTLRCEVFVVN